MKENKPSILDPDDDAPDLSAPEWRDKLASAPVRRGRPRLESPKASTTIRLDSDVLAYFRATGEGWQTRINEALRVHIAEPPRGKAEVVPSARARAAAKTAAAKKTA